MNIAHATLYWITDFATIAIVTNLLDLPGWVPQIWLKIFRNTVKGLTRKKYFCQDRPTSYTSLFNLGIWTVIGPL